MRVNGQTITLTPTEYDILRILIQHAGKVLTHQQLVHAVWGTSYEADAHLLRVNISNLRRKIEVDPARPRYIVTEPGVGYRLKAIGSLIRFDLSLLIISRHRRKIMLFSIALLIVIVFIAFKAAPVEKKEHALFMVPDRLVCWLRLPYLEWTISLPTFMPPAR